MSAKRKIIKAFPKNHEQIRTTKALLTSEFCDRAKAAKIKIKGGKQNRNVPGMAEALDCLISHTPISEYVGELIQKAQGAQA